MKKGFKNANSGTRQTIFGLIGGLIVFIITILLDFPFILSAILAILVYFAIYLLTKEKIQIQGQDVDLWISKEELVDILREANYDINILDRAGRNAQNEEIREEAINLYTTSINILQYIEKNPSKVGDVKRFFNFYLSKAADVLSIYLKMLDTNTSQERMKNIEDRTIPILKKLKEAFNKQYDALLMDNVESIEDDLERLEKELREENIG